MEQVPLTAQKRTITGRKVKTLRREGQIPAHVFGHKIKTEHIQIKAADFAKVFAHVGETGIIDLQVEGLSSEASAKGETKKPVMVRGVQIHPVTDQILHVDLYQINLSEKVKVNVPLEIVNEAPAVAKKLGLLLTPVTEAEIEALPQDLPESIPVDISNLAVVGAEIKLKDLKIDRSKIAVLTDEELVVAQIGELVTKEMEAVEAEIEAEAAATVEAAAGEEVPAAEAAEGAPPEGEAAPEGQAEVESKEKPQAAGAEQSRRATGAEGTRSEEKKKD
ncbi:50S ribosomal protein L25 [Candidatus Curtissbacteria bacterium]|nr:50S ribosomal protein L25 [Candidatus Curtissbacteria bacterium]